MIHTTDASRFSCAGAGILSMGAGRGRVVFRGEDKKRVEERILRGRDRVYEDSGKGRIFP
jgi:hypothetical protein